MYREIAYPARTGYLVAPASTVPPRRLSRRDYWRAMLRLFAWLRWRCR